MQIYILLNTLVAVISLFGLIRTWRVLKQYPSAITFAKWPLSLLIVLLVCSVLTIIDLAVYDIVTNQILNVLSAVELLYSAVVAGFMTPFIFRIRRDV